MCIRDSLYSASSLRDDGTTLDYDLSLGGGVWLNGSQLWHLSLIHI